MSPLLQTLTDISVRAGCLVMQSYRSTFEIDFKGPNDPVTSADRAANDFICRELANRFPTWPIVAEESDPRSFAAYRDAEYVFFVDPLDGTQEFVDRTDEFVVMIGLVQRERAIAGVIYSPVTGHTWCGEVGLGALRSLPHAELTAITASSVTELAHSHVLVSRAHRFDQGDTAIDALGAASVRSMGSAGLKGAMVAEGSADAYVAPRRAGKRWDVCAIDAVVTAAGGCVTDTTGQLIDYRSASLVNDRGMVVSNLALHSKIVECLAGTRSATW